MKLEQSLGGRMQEAAELVASRSCGEGWLLQPKISDMPEMEYRCSPPAPLAAASASGSEAAASMASRLH